MDFARAEGWKLTSKSRGAVDASELGGKVVAVYFSAHWCPPCRGFTPVLKQFYESIKAAGISNFEIVFVSSDRSEAEGKEYFQNDHGDWLMLDHGQGQSLGEKFQVRGIPSLIVIDSSGKAVDPEARNAVAGASSPDQAKAVVSGWAKLCADWRESAGSSLGGAPAAGSAEAMRAARLARLGGAS
eukprot:TRINITY_DN32980_c0_g1_i1.p1 TRINITY_DN32980_c0_g1~~TRINITY_DN32980_c0_g1_i1.p1  ORF type:complete len:185 (+),score=33.37 TRINITY_DN32980_c0_g1_i1:64-618(+)